MCCPFSILHKPYSINQLTIFKMNIFSNSTALYNTPSDCFVKSNEYKAWGGGVRQCYKYLFYNIISIWNVFKLRISLVMEIVNLIFNDWKCCYPFVLFNVTMIHDMTFYDMAFHDMKFCEMTFDGTVCDILKYH